MTEEQVSSNSTTAMRYNKGKLRYDLLPVDSLEDLVRLHTVGAQKYEPRNWEKGMGWCSVFASLMRHAWKWMGGEDFDEETGCHHMTCVAWNAMVLASYRFRKIGTDDRPVISKPTDHQTSIINLLGY